MHHRRVDASKDGSLDIMMVAPLNFTLGARLDLPMNIPVEAILDSQLDASLNFVRNYSGTVQWTHPPYVHVAHTVDRVIYVSGTSTMTNATQIQVENIFTADLDDDAHLRTTSLRPRQCRAERFLPTIGKKARAI